MTLESHAVSPALRGEAPDDSYPFPFALNLAQLWRAGKLIGGDEDCVRNALLDEIERLTNKLNTDSQNFQIECLKAENARVLQERSRAICAWMSGLPALELTGELAWEKILGHSAHCPTCTCQREDER